MMLVLKIPLVYLGWVVWYADQGGARARRRPARQLGLEAMVEAQTDDRPATRWGGGPLPAWRAARHARRGADGTCRPAR